MPIVTGVRFKTSGRTYYFSPGELTLNTGDAVIVETARGIEYGNVVLAPREVEEDKIVAPLKNVVRLATAKDEHRLKENTQREKDAISVCEEKIAKHQLPMKLVNVEYTFDRKKILFYFTSDGRVDFRNLVKDLAGTFKTRIELRQIGVRDEAKLLGGIGTCGRELCCKTFLSDFHPVSIKMAKDQGISLNPSKISGLCGRLMCCLEYEHTFYKSVKKDLKKLGSTVMTPQGPGYVLENLVLQEMCKVKIVMPGDNFEVVKIPFNDVRSISDDEFAAESEKVKNRPAHNFNNPYETWDLDAKPKTDKQKSNNRNKRKRRPNRRNRSKSSGGGNKSTGTQGGSSNQQGNKSGQQGSKSGQKNSGNRSSSSSSRNNNRRRSSGNNRSQNRPNNNKSSNGPKSSQRPAGQGAKKQGNPDKS